MEEEDGMDDRFKKVLTDPRFKRLPSRKKKIKIDSRFEGMFDKRFNGEPLIDKRGRKVQNTKNDGLKRFYELTEDGEKPGVSDIGRKLRGEGNDEDSSSSDESSSEEEEEEDETEQAGQVESEVPRTEEITCRFAITNVDWDRLKAVDLFVLLNSFKPNEGEIVSVKIYPSQFGKERMEKEKLEGPKELTDIKLDDEEEDPYSSNVQDADEIINLDAPFVSEKLRQYQINRLKYFYAVVECDKPETAATLYDQLDGMEYESSASTLDCRFIPDDMSFDEDEPDSICNEMPSLIDYIPPNFITTALQQTKVNLTWDETDPKRAKTLQKAFTERDKISDDLACYLASSSSEEEEEEEDDNDDNYGSNQNASDDEDETVSLQGKSVQDRISKYKDLLKSVEEEEAAEDDGDIDMEIKWEPELENIGKKIAEKKQKESMTVFEKQMAERKVKRKENSIKTKTCKNEIDDSENEPDEDMENSEENNEDYESENDDNQDEESEQSDENNESDEDNSDDKDEQGADDLALLVMDNEKKDKKHFNYENFVENKKSRRKMKKKDKPQQEEDNFEFDEDDPRFKAIYNSHLYNIDQSSSHFKKTQAYDKILKRKASKDPDQKYHVKRSK
ncbi:ESF1 homolog [Panonychus citri]|nr:ESF1 homolog [Panonychus citri]